MNKTQISGLGAIATTTAAATTVATTTAAAAAATVLPFERIGIRNPIGHRDLHSFCEHYVPVAKDS